MTVSLTRSSSALNYSSLVDRIGGRDWVKKNQMEPMPGFQWDRNSRGEMLRHGIVKLNDYCVLIVVIPFCRFGGKTQYSGDFLGSTAKTKHLWLERDGRGGQDVAGVFFLDEGDYPEVGALPRGVYLQFGLGGEGGSVVFVRGAQLAEQADDRSVVQVVTGVFAGAHRGMQALFGDGQPDFRRIRGSDGG